ATLVSPVRIVRDYSYDSTRFWGPGWLVAGDAACFIDPVFSTGVHLACLAGRPEEEVLPEYERSYRGAFERYLRFLYFFYDHNADPDSYFWTARQILHHTPADLDARTAFVRLVSGGADREAIPALVEREQERWAAATR